MSVELFDTHCHLTFDGLIEQCDRVIDEAETAGVTRMITVACVPEDFEPALAIHGRHEHVLVAAGLHPHEARRGDDAFFEKLSEMWRHPAVVAAGEMGLDYHYDFSPRETQREVFARQLDMAARADLPIIIHCREAHNDAVGILIEHGFTGKDVVFHCFSGTPDEAAELIDKGWWLSYTGVITFRNAEAARRSCITTPADRIMFETDAPYLSPHPVRKMRPNVPANVAHTVRFAAGAREESFGNLAKTSTSNARRFFAVPD